MTVFVAGVHGVGKTHLCQQYNGRNGCIHESSSSLIKKELMSANWETNKKVSNIDANQVALKQAVKKITARGNRLLLDGHFVLIDQSGSLKSIDKKIFSDIGITGVILIEASEELITSRLLARDTTTCGTNLKKFIDAECKNAQEVCKFLAIPLFVLNEPTFDEFSQVVDHVFDAKE